MNASRRILAACLLVLCPALAAGESYVCSLSAAGLTVSDLDMRLYLSADAGSDFVATAAGGITVAAGGAGDVSADYVIAALPEPEGGETYALVIEDPYGALCSLSWPARTRAPQSLAWTPTFTTISGRVVGVGDTMPDLATVFSGFSADPSTGSATYSMWCGGILVVDAEAATITNPVQSGATFQATFGYDWQAADTAVAGTCLGRFRFDDGAGGIASLPARSSLTVEILGAP